MLSLYAKQELKQLMEQTNHSLTIDDFDDVARLNNLCNAITDDSEPINDIIDMPVVVGGYQLKQPTIGILEWYNDFYLPMFETNPLMADAGLAFALSLSDTPSQLWELDSKRAVKREVKRFLRRLSCSHIELQEVLVKLLGIKDDEPKAEGDKGNAGGLIAMLCKEYGHTVDYWLWDAPIGIINTFVHDYVSRAEAEVEAARNATTTNKPAPAKSRQLKFKALRDCKNELRDKWQKM